MRSISQIEGHIKEVYEANKQIVDFLESTTLLRHYAMITNAGARLKKFIIHTLQLFPKSKESTIAEPQANIRERKSEIGYYIQAASTKTALFQINKYCEGILYTVTIATNSLPKTDA